MSKLLYKLALITVSLTSAKRLKLIFVLLLLYALSGCITRKACENRFGQCGNIAPEYITETIRDTTVITDLDTVNFAIPLWRTDTVKSNRVIREYRTTYTEAGGDVRFWWTNDSTLRVWAVCPRDTVKIKGKDTVKTVTQTKTVEVEKPVSWWFGWQWWLLAGVIGAFLGILLGR